MDDKIKNFLKGMKCVIADPSSGFAGSIKSLLMEMGLKNEDIRTASQFNDALELIRTMDPQILVTEYGFQEHSGLALVDEVKRLRQDNSICIMITNDSSDTIVAEAAEERVDAFLLKPFSSGSFAERLTAVIESRIKPTPYMVAMYQGKSLMAEKQYEAALRVFRAGKKLHEKPSLACYYAGLMCQKLNDLEGALAEYREGRKHYSLHYLSLFGEFEILVNSKRFKEAHELIEVLQDTFPLTPYRLGQILICIIFSHRYDRLSRCYEQILKLPKRPPELTRVAVQAFMAAARVHLKTNKKAEALDYYNKALLVSGRNLQTLEMVVNDLLTARMVSEARAFLGKVSKPDMTRPEFQKIEFKVDAFTMPRLELIERGRKLVAEGLGDREIYLTTVRLMVEEGKRTLAESIVYKALQEMPDLKQSLYEILETKRAA